MKKRALIIFTRVPVPGQTKTRLMPYFRADQCAKLHICFLKDIAKSALDSDVDIYVCHTPEDRENLLHDIFGKDADYFLQTGDDLGERMYWAIESVLLKGYASCVLIGTDVPEIQRDDIENAFKILEKNDVVFGPTKDGGYYLVGMRQAIKEVFEKQTYGHGSVLENTIQRLEQSKLTIGLAQEHFDIDTREDVQSYRDRLRSSEFLRKTFTGKYLMRTSHISIIVPIYNEEKTIQALLRQLDEIKDSCEIILVDGGSTDETLNLIDSGFRVIHSEKGRAKQMNAGAKESSGDVLFFLHCDSELPRRPLEQIRSVMKKYRVGCFGINYHSRNFFMFTCRVISNHRIKDRNVVFGDQGIFIDRKLFFDIGMFPEIPIMEDYQLSLTLKERGEKIGITGKRIYTSDRRFPNGTIGKLKEMWKMNRLRKKYRDGVDIDEIARMYTDIR